jgi:predicted transcriptional regulator
MAKLYSTYEVADVVKGAANHYRLDILSLLAQQDELSLESISEILDINYKTASVHIGRMHRSGLLTKRYSGHFVLHSITKRGTDILKFLRKLE